MYVGTNVYTCMDNFLRTCTPSYNKRTIHFYLSIPTNLYPPVRIRGPDPLKGNTGLRRPSRGIESRRFLSRSRGEGITCSEAGQCKQHYFLSIEFRPPLLARPVRGLPAQGKKRDSGFLSLAYIALGPCAAGEVEKQVYKTYKACTLVKRVDGAMTLLSKLLWTLTM